MLIIVLVNNNFNLSAKDMREVKGVTCMANFLTDIGRNKSSKFSGIFEDILKTCMKEVRKVDLPKDRMD